MDYANSFRAARTPTMSALALAIAAVLAPSVAPAQTSTEPIDEVRVVGSANTAPNLERIKDLPQSISIVSGEDLDRFQARDIKDLVQYVGNVAWSAGNSRTSAISIRGVGKQAQTDAMDPSVGVVVDEVPYAYNPLATFGFFDVETIQVTRGPQGTTFGKNASVGVIKVTTKRPSLDESDTQWQVTLGQNSRVTGSLATGGPLIDGRLAWRAALNLDKGDGDYANLYDTDHSFMNRDKTEGRLQLLWSPRENFQARFIADINPRGQEFYNGWSFHLPTPTRYANGDPNTALDTEQRLARRWFAQAVDDFSYQRDYLGNTINMDNQRPLVTRSSGTSAQFDWDIGKIALTAVTAWRDYEFRAGNDEGTTFDVTKNGGGFATNTQTSQEIRISSTVGDLIDYQAGLYFLDQSTNYVSGGDDHGADAGAWFANAARYNRLDANPAGRYLLMNSLWRLQPRVGQEIDNSTSAIFGNADWHLGDRFTLTTGVRLTSEDRRNASWKRLVSEGYAPELDPAQVNGVQLAGFDSNAAGVLSANNTPEQLAIADLTANKYFAVPTYGALTAAQRQLIADAKATRAGRIGVLWSGTQYGTFEDTQPTYVVSPSFKFTDNITGYVALQYGEKAGIALITNGLPTPARPEKTKSSELGVKSSLLDGELVFNASVFVTDIEDYQQQVLIFDEYTTNLNNDGQFYYTAQTGNAEQVRAQGLEIDSVYYGVPNLAIRLSAAYNDGYYEEFTRAPQPVENTWPGAPSYRDATGETLPGASKVSASLGFDYTFPSSGDKSWRLSVNTAYASKYKSDVALSEYSWIAGHSTTDIAVGLDWRNYNISFLVKNALDDRTPLSATWNSLVPAIPRWAGVTIGGQL
jgi:outer membrane receptor protein involved in Fe transport